MARHIDEFTGLPLDDQMDAYAEEQVVQRPPQRRPGAEGPISTARPRPAPPVRAGDYPIPPVQAPAPTPTGYNRAALSQAVQGIQFGADPNYSPAEFIRQNQGGFAQGVTMVSPDKIRLPDGEIVDIGGDISAGGTGRAWWGSEKDWQEGQARGAFGPGGGGTSAIGGAAPGGAGGGGFGVSARRGAGDPMYDAIQRLLARGERPVTREDIGAQFDPVSRQYQRGAQRSREQAAERLAQQGLNVGGQGGPLDVQVSSINERLAEQEGGLMAQLMGQEIASRRQDVANALQFAQGEERLQLQLQLAQMDDELRRLGLGQQREQFYDRMGYDVGRDEYLFNQLFQQGLGE